MINQKTSTHIKNDEPEKNVSFYMCRIVNFFYVQALFEPCALFNKINI